MENETIHIHLIVDVPAETAAGFEALMNELVAVASKEEGTLVYEWYATGDGRTWHILERYADAERGDAHVRGFAENFAARFFELVSSCKAIVSNNATPYIRGVLEGLAPTYITQCAGLHRF